MRLPLLVAAILSLASAVAATWPVWEAPSRAILCNFVHPDCLSNHWLMVWVAERTLTLQSLLHNDRYYWPVGDAPWLAGNGSEGFAYAPFHALLGWPLGANVYLVAVLALNGIAATVLARASGASPWASVVAAPAGALLVYCIQELGAGRFSQVSVCWLAFFLAAWISFQERGGWGRALLAAALLAVTALFYWYYAFFGVMAGALVALVYLPRRGPTAPTIAHLAGFSAACLVFVGPLLYVFLAHWQAIPGTDEATFPHPEAVVDSTWPGIPFIGVGGRHSGRALPFATCVLALAGIWSREHRRAGLALLLVGLGFATLMAGVLVPGGPYETIYGLAGPLRRFWWPYRHVVVLNLAVIALSARGLDRLAAARWWIVAPLAASLPWQLDVQGSAWRAQFSLAAVPVPFYEEVGAQPGSVLLEPPLSPEVASAQTPLIYQLFHRKALLGGHAMWVARVRPPEWDERVAANSFLAEMRELDNARLDGTFRFDGADLRALVDAGVRQIVVNEEYFPLPLRALPAAYLEICEQLFGPPIASTKRARAFDMGAWNGRTEATFTPFAWPSGLSRGGPTLSIQAPRPASLAFSVPFPSVPSAPPPPPGGPR